MKPKFLLKLSELISDFTITLSYFNPALNNMNEKDYDMIFAWQVVCFANKGFAQDLMYLR